MIRIIKIVLNVYNVRRSTVYSTQSRRTGHCLRMELPIHKSDWNSKPFNLQDNRKGTKGKKGSPQQLTRSTRKLARLGGIPYTNRRWEEDAYLDVMIFFMSVGSQANNGKKFRKINLSLFSRGFIIRYNSIRKHSITLQDGHISLHAENKPIGEKTRGY